MAKAKVPFAGKEKRKTSNGKLPVPPPTPAQQAASAATPKAKPKASVWVDGVQIAAGDPGPVPEALKVENRQPLSKKAQAELDKKMAAAKTQSTDTRQAELRAAQKAHKAEVAAVKRNAKKEKEAAVAKGATTAMPAQGKDALKMIAGKSPVAIAKKRANGKRDDVTAKDAERVLKLTPREPGKGKRAKYDWKGARDEAAKGKVPSPPDFSANTHRCYRPALAAVVELVNKRDLAALKAHRVEGSCSSPQAIKKFREIALIALAVKAESKSKAAR
jgi:hypothetical protein